MKKTLLIVLGVIIVFTAMAQPRGRHRSMVIVKKPTPDRVVRPGAYYGCSPWKTTYYGFQLGLNVSSVRSDAPVLDGKGSKTGLNIGFSIGKQLSWNTPLFVETGLMYTQKGGNSSSGNPKGKFTYQLDYLELPIVLKYKHYTMSGVSVEPFAGAYLSCGISGDIKDYGERQACSSYSDNEFNRFDGGLRVGCGIGYGLGYAQLAYDLGLTNVGQDNFDNTRNGCFTMSVGVKF